MRRSWTGPQSLPQTRTRELADLLVGQYPLAEGETMGVISLLRKGFGYVLLSMGVSSPDAAKKKPAPTPAPKPDSQKQ